MYRLYDMPGTVYRPNYKQIFQEMIG